MTLFSSIKKIFSKSDSPPEPPQREPINIYGQKIYDPDFYDHVYPWETKKIADPDLVIADLILLWVIKRLGLFTQKYPIHLSRNYGITDYKTPTYKFIKLGLLNEDGTITQKGLNFINDNKSYIDLHKKGWKTEEDLASAKASWRLFQTNHANYLEKIGCIKEADDLRKQIKFDKARETAWEQFVKGEKLSKQKNYQHSNTLLLPLLEHHGVDFTASLYERIAINYRGLKDYHAEIAICKEFLLKQQVKYGGNMWVDTFKKRIAFAEKKINSISQK